MNAEVASVGTDGNGNSNSNCNGNGNGNGNSRCFEDLIEHLQHAFPLAISEATSRRKQDVQDVVHDVCSPIHCEHVME